MNNKIFINGKYVSKLENGMEVKRSLDLSHHGLDSLPDDFLVLGSLKLKGNRFTKVPKNLVVGIHLFMGDSKIEKIPNDLVVGANLYLGNSRTSEMESGLVIGKSLYVEDCPMKFLPDNLTVGRDLYLTDSVCEKHLVEKAIAICDLNEFELNLVNERWTKDFAVHPRLRDFIVKALPKGLKVWGKIYLSGLKIQL